MDFTNLNQSVGAEPLVMFGNRSEPFGIGITRAAEQKS